MCKELNYQIDILPEGHFEGNVGFQFKNYKIFAFPGPKVIIEGRAEHPPLHIHIDYPQGKLKIDCETLEELEGKKVPRDLRRHLKTNKQKIKERAENIFLTGKY